MQTCSYFDRNLLIFFTYWCEYGVLKNCFGEGDLELYEGSLDLEVENWEQETVSPITS